MRSDVKTISICEETTLNTHTNTTVRFQQNKRNLAEIKEKKAISSLKTPLKFSRKSHKLNLTDLFIQQQDFNPNHNWLFCVFMFQFCRLL